MNKLYVIEVVQTREDGGTTVRTSWMSNGDALVVEADSAHEAFDEAMNAASPEMRQVLAGWNETGEWTLRPREAQMMRSDALAMSELEERWNDENYADDEDAGDEPDQLDYDHNSELPCSQY